jgi:hypothetical protein
VPGAVCGAAGMPAATGLAVCLAVLRAGRGRGSAVSGPDDGVADVVCRTADRAWPMAAAGGTADRAPYAVRSTAAIAPPAMIAAATIRAVTPVRKLISSSQAYTAARILPARRRAT